MAVLLPLIAYWWSTKDTPKECFAPPGRPVFFVVLPVCLPVSGLFEGWLPFRRTWSSVCMRHGFYSTSSSLEPNFWNNPYLCLSKDGLFFLQDRCHRCLTWNGWEVLQNFTSHRGHAVGFSLSQGGTRCWGDLTCSVWFNAEVWPPVAGLSHKRPNRLIITRGWRCFQPCNWICICQSFRELLAWLKPSLRSSAATVSCAQSRNETDRQVWLHRGWGGTVSRRPFF